MLPGCTEVEGGAIGGELFRVTLLRVDLIPLACQLIEGRFRAALPRHDLLSCQLSGILKGRGAWETHVLHRVRIEVSSSNFPRFDRNMNTGGNNYDETEGVIARNTIHHSRQYASKIVLTVVKRQPEPTATAVAAVHQ